MPGKLVTTAHNDLTYKIIGCAMKVHRTLGPGLREDTYQRDLGVKLDEGKMEHEPQKLLEVYDSSQGNILIGYYIPDRVCRSISARAVWSGNGFCRSRILRSIKSIGSGCSCRIG